MFKKLLLTPSKALLYTQPSARVSSLREYVTLFESLNTSAAERAESSQNALAQKYNISRDDLSTLSQIVNSEPELLKNFIDRESWLRTVEETKFLWRKSPFFIPGKSFESAVEELKQKYPEVVSFDVNNPERARAYQILESIFLRDGPKIRDFNDANAVQRFNTEWVKRIQGHINELQNTTKASSETAITGLTAFNAIAQINHALSTTAQRLERDPTYAFGRIRHMIAVHKLRRGELKISEDRLPKIAGSRTEQDIATEEFGEEVNDIQLLTAEKNTQLRKELGYNFLPWINDRKIIFETTIEQGQTLIWGALAGTFGAYLLYKLYQGDATDLTLLGTAAILGISLRKFRQNVIKNRLPYLVQMNLHKNGQQLDLFVQHGYRNVTKVEGVNISDFKVHRGDYKFETRNQARDEIYRKATYAKKNYTLSDLRKAGILHGSWVATFGDQIVFVPMDHSGNRQVLDSIFKGKSLELTA